MHLRSQIMYAAHLRRTNELYFLGYDSVLLTPSQQKYITESEASSPAALKHQKDNV